MTVARGRPYSTDAFAVHANGETNAHGRENNGLRMPQSPRINRIRTGNDKSLRSGRVTAAATPVVN